MPSLEALWNEVRQLAATPANAGHDVARIAELSTFVPAADDAATIRLETMRETELFRALPAALRARYSVWLGEKLPLWMGDCPRCDHKLTCANDSYGRDTYTRLYWCRACGWRDEQPTDEPTMASIHTELNRHRDEDVRRKISDQIAFGPIAALSVATPAITDVIAAPDDTHARRRFANWLAETGNRVLAAKIQVACQTALPTHWAWASSSMPSGWYGPIVELLGDLKLSLLGLCLAQGFPDFVVVDATTFLARGHELFERAPIRCVRLVDAEPVLAAVFASPLTQRLVGLELELSGKTRVVDVMRAAPPMPRLRHLDLGTTHRFTLDEITTLANARCLVVAACVHLPTERLVEEDDRDYMSFYSLSEHAHAIEKVAQRTRRAWLEELLKPAYAAATTPRHR